MTKSPPKNVPDVGIELGAACMPSGHASDRATTPVQTDVKTYVNKGKENKKKNSMSHCVSDFDNHLGCRILH